MSLSRFTKVYHNLPISERTMVCAVIDGEGVTWKLAYKYIKEKTELGEKIQVQLEKLDLI